MEELCDDRCQHPALETLNDAVTRSSGIQVRRLYPIAS
jgi:hypothetical protein